MSEDQNCPIDSHFKIFWGGNGKLQKIPFLLKPLLHNIFVRQNFFPDRTMWKLTSQGFPKCGKIFASQKCRGEGVLAKNAVFCNFKWPPQQNFQMAINRTILILEALPMANLKAYVPNFPNHMRERSQSLKLWVLCPSKVRWSWFVSNKNSVFWAFVCRKSLFWPISTSPESCASQLFSHLPSVEFFLN